MAAKNKHGLDTRDLLLDLVLNLTPTQVEDVYSELLPRYTRRARVKLYNENGEEDTNGLIRLLPLQYKTIRTKYGDTFMIKSFTELTNYIKYLENNLDRDPNYKAKLQKLKTGSHNSLIAKPNGWVYQKCKGCICTDRVRNLATNPYLIDDINTAREYVLSVPRAIRENSLDVQMLIMKFPELAGLDNDE